MQKPGFVYMLASACHATLYIGVTSDLTARILQHKADVQNSLGKLVWFESYDRIESAMVRERLLQSWNHEWKTRLIETANPQWLDLAHSLSPPRGEEEDEEGEDRG